MTKRRLRDELVIEAWQHLSADSLGASELESIRKTLANEFGERATPGPAAIARTLAEHGAQLRHAEVLGVDTLWRTRRLNELFVPGELDFTSIANALDSIMKLDDLLMIFNSEGDEPGQENLLELAREIKFDLQSTAAARIVAGSERLVAAEVVEWLTIWLQTPHIFADWLEIRRGSEEFCRRFETSTDYADFTEKN